MPQIYANATVGTHPNHHGHRHHGGKAHIVAHDISNAAHNLNNAVKHATKSHHHRHHHHLH